jgi:hypothetical protein
MKTQLITVAALAMVAIPAHALQGLTTCHAAGTTATSISGFDTRTAKMTSAYTRPDAMEYCNREITEQHGLGVAACADRFMRDNSGVVITVWANCAATSPAPALFSFSLMNVERARDQASRGLPDL